MARYGCFFLTESGGTAWANEITETKKSVMVLQILTLHRN
jgi:hypothetical protein